MEVKKLLKKVWHFIWEEESILSWIVNIILAFVIIKFLLYPGLGWVLGTPAPIVAVVSGSMEHDAVFDDWWNTSQCCDDKCSSRGIHSPIYLNHSISKEQFESFPFVHGFNKGDIMALLGPEKISVGDILVYRIPSKSDPIIHRVVNIREINGKRIFTTKGDHNCAIGPFEQDISEEQVVGKAVLRVPLLGWVKIGFVYILQTAGIWR